MVSLLTWYLVGAGLTFLGIFAAFVYYQSTAENGPRLYRYGLTPRRTTVASVLALAVAVLVVVATAPPWPVTRGSILVVGLWTVLLVASANGLAGTVGFAHRWRRFHPENAVDTGTVSAGPVAVSGTVTDDATTVAPVTDREAVVFVWSAGVEDPYVGTEMAETGDLRKVDAGRGGTVFRLDDGSGPVRVDSAGARLDLGGRQTVEVPAGEELPRPHTDAISDVEFDHGDSARRYTEWVLAPGDGVSVAGEARRRDGRPVLTDAVVTTGSLTATAEGYRARTLLYALAGLGGVAVALWGLLAV